MVTPVSDENRDKRIRKKLGIATEALLKELARSANKGDTDPKKVASAAQMLDRYMGNIPATLPKAPLANSNPHTRSAKHPNNPYQDIPDMPI